MTIKNKIQIIIIIVFCWNFSNGQNYNLVNTFTTNEGLPSNHIYELCEDNDGFLWVPTENGVSRFDGTRFVNYSTKDGLPSNDVLQIIKSNDGTIWANCYKQPPSYFDIKLNKFISFENDKEILKISSSFLEILNLPNDGIIFQNKIGTIKFKNSKKPIINLKENSRIFIYNNEELVVKYQATKIIDKSYNVFSFYDINNELKGEAEFNAHNTLSNVFYEQNTIYFFSENTITKETITNLKSFAYKEEKINVNEAIKWITIKENNLNIVTKSGNIYIYNKNTLKLKFKINNTINCSNALLDKYNNLWVSTEDKGLLYFNTSQIKQVVKKEDFSNNFISVLKTDSNLFAGNLVGQILDKSKETISTHNLAKETNSFWVRNIFDFNKKSIAISDVGYTLNYEKTFKLRNRINGNCSLKTAEKLNDSILLLGDISGIFKLNVSNGKYSQLNVPIERILAIKKINENSFYFLGNDGIFKHDYIKNKYKLVILNDDIKNDRIGKFQLDENKNLWLSTVKGSLLLYQKEKLVLKIPNSVGLPENITDIFALENKLWVASKSGLYVVDYLDLKKYKINKIPKFEGLTSNEINAISYKNDTLYLATNNGISIVPKNFKFSKFDIKPFVISIKVNNENVPLNDAYNLKKEEKNIIIQLAGIDLSGHFKNFQYAINSTKKWIDLEGNILNLLLKDGQNDVFIRVIDVNNNISSKHLQLNFSVAIPFYNTLWFWSIFSFIIIGLGFWFFNRNKFNQQKIAFSQQLELEKQRNRITADLHDEIGSTLSSLQINSSIANKLLDKNPKEAHKVMEKIEMQSEQLSEKIGDIIWSMKPGKDEFLTLTSRVKNFANDILGETSINYSISIDEKIDSGIENITIRKNILLFLKESINNAAKYSQATSLNLNLIVDNKIIYITIIDNGVGFDVKKVHGNGIGNMEKRINELNGDFELISELNKGTKIKAKFPLIP